jgi:hypothetical protein
MKYKQDENGNVIKTTYPPHYQQNKQNHKHKFDKVMENLRRMALTRKWTGTEGHIADFVYNYYYKQYNCNIEDITISMENDDPTAYVCWIDNDKWSVCYYFRYLDEREQVETFSDYITQNLSRFDPEMIYQWFLGHFVWSGEIEPSNFEDTDTKCPLCLEDYCEERVADKLHNCGHKYCGDCIESALEYGTCSICRMTTTQEIEIDDEKLTFDKVKELCRNDETEILVGMLKDSGNFIDFRNNYMDDNEISHILGFDNFEHYYDDFSEGMNILMSRMDIFERKTETLYF